MKYFAFLLLGGLLLSCEPSSEKQEPVNPILVGANEEIPFDQITDADIRDAFEYAKNEMAKRIDAIAAVKDENRNFDNTLLAQDDMVTALSEPYAIIYLMGSTHPDSLVRETAVEIRNEFAKMFNELSLNEDLYRSTKAYSTSEEAASLEGYRARFLEKTLRSFERNGFALDVESRGALKELLNEITTLSNRFSTNIATYQDFLILDESGMEGMNDDYKKAHRQEDGSYKVGLSYPDSRPFLKNATSSKQRKALLTKYLNRAADTNLELLDTLIIKRQEMATLLGYSTFAAYQTEERMVKSPENAWEFEKKLTKSLKPKGELDNRELTAFQKELFGIDKPKVDAWDKSFLVEELMTRKYGVDEEEVRKYFPIESVKEGLFSITQRLFQLTYVKVENAQVWHTDVTAYDVMDAEGKIGRFYLDLHPRSNKYNHAACFPIRNSKKLDNGERQLPIASLVCNFTEPTDDKPALMTHGEVETFFHEFGHVLHTILSKTQLESQAGFTVAQDFVEAPSQIFENWVWNYEALSLFAKHYETGETMPKELFDKIWAARNVMSGQNNLQQVFYGSYDLTLHDGYLPGKGVSTTDILKALQSGITFTDYIEGTHFQAAFGHLTGYASSYYGYMWSLVYAQDMFSRFEEKGILNPEVGMEYRNKILSRGSEMDEMEMLKDFLGREPNEKAFIKSIGL